MTGRELKEKMEAFTDEELDLVVLIDLAEAQGYTSANDVAVVYYRSKAIAISIKEE